MRAVAAGDYHSLVVSEEGRVYSFGAGEDGKLGHGDDENQLTPRLIEGLRTSKVCAVAAGTAHSLAISSKGIAYGWGIGEEDEQPDARLGLGLQDNALVPVAYPDMACACG